MEVEGWSKSGLVMRSISEGKEREMKLAWVCLTFAHRNLPLNLSSQSSQANLSVLTTLGQEPCCSADRKFDSQDSLLVGSQGIQSLIWESIAPVFLPCFQPPADEMYEDVGVRG